MASWFVYVVRCRDGSLYTGISTDVDARVARHNAGAGARYTRARGPVALVHVERKRSRSNALRREAAIKSLTRARKVELVSAGRIVRRSPGTPPRATRAIQATQATRATQVMTAAAPDVPTGGAR